jgi:hypothetical protein
VSHEALEHLMIPSLFASLWLASSAALAGPLPDIDEPLRAGARAPRDAAVVVGIEDYTHIADVPWATRDAQAFYRLLVYTVGVPAARVRLLDAGASHEMIRDALAEAAERAGPDGRVWFYFAGHGAASSRDGQRMILGQDVRAEVAAFDSRGLTTAELEELAGAEGSQVVMVLDTCYTGRDRAGASLVEGGRFAVPSYATRTAPRVVSWTAAGPNELARPLDSVGHGAFTYFVVGALRGWADGQLDGVRDGEVTLEEASLYVTDALAAAQLGSQHPSVQGGEAERWVLSASSKLEAAPELDATTGLRPATPLPASASYLDALERQAAAEQRLAAERARLEILHLRAVEDRAALIRAEAHEEWLRVQGIADTGGEAGAQALRTFIGRWEDYSEEIDGVREPIEIPDLPRARERLNELARQLALSGYGLVPPVELLSNGRFRDGTGAELRARDLGPIVSAVSPACDALEIARKRRAISWGMVAGGGVVMLAGFIPFAVDDSNGEPLINASDGVRKLGYVGIYGGLLTMSSGYTLSSRWGYDPKAFLDCAQQAAGGGRNP